jgi:hypothetical protein
MIRIEVLKPGNSTEDEPEVLKVIEIAKIEPSRVTPVNEQVGSPMPIADLADLLPRIKPVEPLDLEELDSYYAQDVEVLQDGNLLPIKTDLPHYIGLRVVLSNVLKEYGTSDNLQIQIS